MLEGDRRSPHSAVRPRRPHGPTRDLIEDGQARLQASVEEVADQDTSSLAGVPCKSFRGRAVPAHPSRQGDRLARGLTFSSTPCGEPKFSTLFSSRPKGLNL